MKYQHWTNDALPPTPGGMVAGATEAPGLVVAALGQLAKQSRASRFRPAIPPQGRYPALEDAPGSFVKVRS